MSIHLKNNNYKNRQKNIFKRKKIKFRIFYHFKKDIFNFDLIINLKEKI